MCFLLFFQRFVFGFDFGKMLSIYFKLKIKANFILYRFSSMLYLCPLLGLLGFSVVLLWFSVTRGVTRKEGAS